MYLNPNKLQICINYKNNEIHIHLEMKYQWKHITLLYSSLFHYQNLLHCIIGKNTTGCQQTFGW